MALPEPLQPDRMRPFSHLVTGIVLRALAAHPDYRRRRETVAAAGLLADRLFAADPYPDRSDPTFWTKLAFPFRWTDVVSALDAIAMVGAPAVEHPGVAAAARWFRDRQRDDGLWSSGYALAADRDIDLWVSFAGVRMLKRLSGSSTDSR